MPRETPMHTEISGGYRPDLPRRRGESGQEMGDSGLPCAEDRVQFDALYRAYVVRVYRYLYRQVANREDAEDLTATTFSKALASFDRYRDQGSLAAWLFSIAHHTLLDHQRRRRLHTDLDAVAPTLVDSVPLPEEHVLRADQAATLHQLIQKLPPDQREALTLRFSGELRTAEIAAVLGRSEGAIKMLVHRAIVALRDVYCQEGNP